MRALITVIIIAAVVGPIYAWDYIPSKSVHKEQFTNADSPTDIVFESTNDWLLYSAYKGAIHKYTRGRKTETYQSDELRYGMCLVKIDRSYYFCDNAGKAVLELGSNYSTQATLTFTDGQKAFDPTDIVKSRNEIYVVDNDNHRVIKYNPSTKETTGILGMPGTARGYLRYPFSAVVDSDSLLYVSEVLNARIQMFAPTGRSTFNVGDWGVEPGKLFRPKGLALIDDNYLVVSDGYMGVLQIFDVYGNYIGVITDEAGKVKKYPSPTRIRAFGQRIAILDFYDHTFEIIEIGRLR